MEFGFKLSPSSVVHLDTTDRRRFDRLAQLVPDVRTCIGCGSCSATCTAAPWSGMSVRKVILGLQRGRDAEIDRMLSACMLCGKCMMVCPRGINTRQLILTLCRLDKKGEVVR